MTALSAHRLERPVVAVVLLALALAVTVAATVGWRLPVLTEPAVGFLLLAGEGFAFGSGHAFAGRQGLAGGWPIVGVIAAGVQLGPARAGAVGGVVGAARIASVLANGVDRFDADRLASLASTVGFYALYGVAAGWVGTLLGRAEREVANTRAREEVARTLHDGVLQTLAVVERRLTDTEPDVARLVRDTERDLRLYIEEPPLLGPRADLRTELRRATRRAAHLHDLDVSVVTVERIELEGEKLGAVEDAVSEAVMNVGKHAGVRAAVVFAQRRDDGSTFVSVRDDGCGFDPASVDPSRHGLRRSILARIESVGGGVQVVSRVGGGTEVRLWVP
jgi:signal transduction histidine kinase